MRQVIAALAMLTLATNAAKADWTATADSTGVAGNVGGAYTWHCPPNGAPGPVWGSGLYTSDSSLCTAAVHGGHISRDANWQITFAILRGAPAYIGSTANGITTNDYGTWTSSFQIIGATLMATTIAPTGTGPRQIDWSTRLVDLGAQGQVGTQLGLVCPPGGGTTGPLWGAGVYTSDSGICLAAVHAGVITTAAGGVVTVVVMEGQSGYAGVTMNGVASSGFGAWGESFSFR